MVCVPMAGIMDSEKTRIWSAPRRVAFRFVFIYFGLQATSFPLSQLPGVKPIAEWLDDAVAVGNEHDDPPGFLSMIRLVALVVAVVILVFFAVGYAFGRLFL